jgi:hypothetical protein
MGIVREFITLLGGVAAWPLRRARFFSFALRGNRREAAAS